MKLALESGQKVKVESLTTQTEQVVANPDTGLFEAEVNANPVRVERDGTWVDLDATLERTGDRITPRAALVDLAIADGGAGPLVTITDASASIGLTWLADSSLPKPTLVGDKAIYLDVRPDIDLVIQSNDYGFSQYLVVRTREAAADPLLQSFDFGVSTTAVNVSSEDGGLTATDGSGETIFGAQRFEMWGSTGSLPSTDPAQISAYVTGDMEKGSIADVPSTLENGRLTLRPDQSLLQSADVQFPIVIDPAISRVQSNWAMVWDNGYHFWNPDDDDHTARVGYDGWSGQDKKSRVFYNFDTRALSGKSVLSATFTHKQVHSPSFDCDEKNARPAVNLDRTGTVSSRTRWPGPDSDDFLDDSTVVAGNLATCRHITTQEWNATAGVRHAASNRNSNLTLRLKSDGESDKWGWRQYQNTRAYPVLSVTYNTPPSVPGAVSVSGVSNFHGAYFLANPRPTLTATVKDPDAGDEVHADFLIDPSDASANKQFSSAAVSNPGVTGKPVTGIVPASTLVNGKSYAISARASDRRNASAFGPAVRVTMDTVAPGSPRITGPKATVAQGSRVMVRVDAPEADVSSYRYGFNSGAQTSTATPAYLGGPVDIPLVASQFGPNFFTVQSLDRAGNRSANAARFEFKVNGTLPSHRYRLDKNGLDTRSVVAAGSSTNNLVAPTTTTWVPGRDARTDGTAAPRDCRDFAAQLTPKTAVKTLATASAPIDTSQSFTVAAWLKPADLSTTSATLGERYAVTMPVSGGAAFSLGYRRDPTSKRVYWTYTIDNPTDRTSRQVIGTAAVPANIVKAGAWSHVVGVYDGATRTASLYVNWTPVARALATVRPIRSSQLMLGTGPFGGTSLTWNGAVDEVLLYQGALTASQVEELTRTRRPITGC